MKPNAWEWDEQDLLDLIRVQVQENVALDYKECGAIQKTDGKKNEISKDVSAFANSAGGVLLYGMKEDGHVPIAIDTGFDPDDISKEWLEQVINSRIQRRIDGVRINQVKLSTTSPGKVAYVVHVPQSTRAPHQASDKRFYKRFNFESVPMEEYEVRDVANRSSTPDLFLDLAFRPGDATTKLTKAGKAADKYFAPIRFAAVVRNESETPAAHAVFHVLVDERIKIENVSDDVNSHEGSETLRADGIVCALKKFTVLWDSNRGLPIFKGMSAELPKQPMRMTIPIGPDWFVLSYIIGAPGMAAKQEIVVLFVKDGVATFKPAREAASPRAPNVSSNGFKTSEKAGPGIAG